MITRNPQYTPCGPPRGRVALLAAAAVLACWAGAGAGAAETERRTRPIVDPIGNYVPIKPKVFKDLRHIEITDYDRQRARNTGKPFAVVVMKEESALEAGEFRLTGVQLEFQARSPKGMIYRFRGRFTRGGDLYSQKDTDEPVLQGHLAAYFEGELIRQEHLRFRYDAGE